MAIVFIKLFFALVISFLITFYLVPFLCNIALKLGVMDNPDGAIKRHKAPTPYLGGVAVYTGFIVALALTFPFHNNIVLFLVGITLLLFVGLVDDLVALKPYQKLFGQCIATFCFLKAGFYLKEHFFYHYWAMPLSILWILTVINAFNLVDVMDGLATTLAIGSTAAFLFLALVLQDYTLVLLLGAFLGPLLAFLWFNKPIAKIYLGDAGALFIGGFLGAVPFLFKWGTHNWLGYLTPIVVLAIPLLEVATLIAIRTYYQIPFYNASPHHFSMYLQKKGWSKYTILGYVGLINCMLLVVAYFFAIGTFGFWELLGAAITGLLFWFFMLFCTRK